jgi:hypothetical protein
MVELESDQSKRLPVTSSLSTDLRIGIASLRSSNPVNGKLSPQFKARKVVNCAMVVR